MFTGLLHNVANKLPGVCAIADVWISGSPKQSVCQIFFWGTAFGK